MTSIDIRPLDLEMRVRTFPENSRTRLLYTLHSPSGVAPFVHREISGPIIQNLEQFSARLMYKIEQLAERRDVGGEAILRAEIDRKLADLGRRLWRELSSPELCHAYRTIRRSVQTWMIVSDEPWIPWELIKPYDDSRLEEVIDDDFLSFNFTLTRWLAGYRDPSEEITVRRLATILATTGNKSPPGSEAERSFLSELAAGLGAEDVSPSLKAPGELLAFLQPGGVDLLHFTGYGGSSGDYGPDELGIIFPDGRSFRPSDLEGPVATRIRCDRPLVFLNTCNGQRGWAARWVGVCGCGAFVAPLWSVRDQAAREFARVFYTALGQGATLGRAAQEAREHLRTTRPLGDTSILTYSVYGHPNARVLFGMNAPAPATPEVLNAPPAFREKIFSFDLLVRRKTEGFVGRQWLFDAIDAFVKREARGYVQILGDPGTGKTALIAELVKRHRHPHHFNIPSEGIKTPDQFLPNLCAQLVARFHLGYSILPPEVARDASVLNNLLEKAAARLRPSGHKLLILVDALDESDPSAVTRGSNPLHLPSDLPDGVFFVVTSRRGGTPLRYACADHKIDLQKETENNFADVRLFAETWLDREGIQAYIRTQGLEVTDFVDEIVKLSEGNFMYLHYFLPEIEKGTYKDRKYTELPVGLENYYEDHWQRMRVLDVPAWEGYKVPVLVALTIAKEPISMDLIADFSGVEKRSQIRAALDEWAAFLQSTELEEDGTKETRWRLYHDSFHDFIAAKDQIQDQLVDLKAAHGKAADALWKALYPER